MVLGNYVIFIYGPCNTQFLCISEVYHSNNNQATTYYPAESFSWNSRARWKHWWTPSSCHNRFIIDINSGVKLPSSTLPARENSCLASSFKKKICWNDRAVNLIFRGELLKQKMGEFYSFLLKILFRLICSVFILLLVYHYHVYHISCIRNDKPSTIIYSFCFAKANPYNSGYLIKNKI